MGAVLTQCRPVAGGATGELLRALHRGLGRDRGGGARARGSRIRCASSGEVDRAITRLQAVRLGLVRAADRAQGPPSRGRRGPPRGWPPRRVRTPRRRRVTSSSPAVLGDSLPATREALAQGIVSTAHAQVIATAAGRLPASLTDAERATIESALVERAKVVDPASLRKTARRALAAAERSQAEVDAHEDEVVRSEEDQALARTRLSWHDNHDGTLSGHFTVPLLAGHMLVKVIQQLASPRRFAQRAAQTARADAAAQGQALTRSGTRERVWDAFRTTPERVVAPVRVGVRRAARAPAHRPALRQGQRDRPGDHGRPDPARLRSGQGLARPTPAPCSAPDRRGDSPAPQDWCRWSWAAPPTRWTWDGPGASSPSTNAPPSPPATTPAPPRTATDPMPGPSSITRTHGRAVAPPTCTSRFPCADTTTG